jgi:hypothetical protein
MSEIESVKYSSYTPAQKKASQLYRLNNKEKINAQRKKYYQKRKENDPNFLEYKRIKAREYYEKKKLDKVVKAEAKPEVVEEVIKEEENPQPEVKEEVKTEEYVSHIPELGPISKASLQLHPDDMEILLKDLSKIPTGFTPVKETKKRKAKKDMKQ